MRFLIFHLFLKPLIRRDYRLRMAGRRPDRFYWADLLALKWGYFVSEIPNMKGDNDK